MTISSYLTALAQSPSKAYDIAIARWAWARAAGSGAASISRWKMTRASAVFPSPSRRAASRSGDDAVAPPPCAERGAAAATSAAARRARFMVNWSAARSSRAVHGQLVRCMARSCGAWPDRAVHGQIARFPAKSYGGSGPARKELPGARRSDPRRRASPRSPPRRHPVLPRIAPGRPALHQLHHRLAAARVPRRERRHLVAQLLERAPHRRSDRRLEPHPQALEVPEPRRVDRLLEVHAEHQQVEQHLHVADRQSVV